MNNAQITGITSHYSRATALTVATSEINSIAKDPMAWLKGHDRRRKPRKITPITLGQAVLTKHDNDLEAALLDTSGLRAEVLLAHVLAMPLSAEVRSMVLDASVTLAQTMSDEN